MVTHLPEGRKTKLVRTDYWDRIEVRLTVYRVDQIKMRRTRLDALELGLKLIAQAVQGRTAEPPAVVPDA
jgi:hypothetical protein